MSWLLCYDGLETVSTKAREANLNPQHNAYQPIISKSCSLHACRNAVDFWLAHSQGMLMVADARGRLLYMNSEMRHILGISDDTVRGFATPHEF
eukprot:1105662-Pelagomonas_calceolata.AAC.1